MAAFLKFILFVFLWVRIGPSLDRYYLSRLGPYLIRFPLSRKFLSNLLCNISFPTKKIFGAQM